MLRKSVYLLVIPLKKLLNFLLSILNFQLSMVLPQFRYVYRTENHMKKNSATQTAKPHLSWIFPVV